MPTKVKICGLRTEAALEAALAGGADYVGLVFFPPSPRNVAPATAKALADKARGRARVVALMVDPDDALIDTVMASVAPDLLQLHGEETPQRAADIRRRWGTADHEGDQGRDGARRRRRARLSRRRRPHPVRCPRARRQHPPRRQRRALRLAHLARRQGSGAVRALGGPDARQRRRGHPRHRRCRSSMSPPASRRSPGEKDPELIRRFLRAAKGG